MFHYFCSTSYISKQEGPKIIIEGSGSVKVKEDQKSANFKYIRTILGEGNEKGVEVRNININVLHHFNFNFYVVLLM